MKTKWQRACGKASGSTSSAHFTFLFLTIVLPRIVSWYIKNTMLREKTVLKWTSKQKHFRKDRKELGIFKNPISHCGGKSEQMERAAWSELSLGQPSRPWSEAWVYSKCKGRLIRKEGRRDLCCYVYPSCYVENGLEKILGYYRSTDTNDAGMDEVGVMETEESGRRGRGGEERLFLCFFFFL